MQRQRQNPDDHATGRIGWLRAAVLGANDGLLSTSSLILGVAAAAAKPADILVAGGAGLVAGAMSMAAGEFVSVSAQSDTETAELAVEKRELAVDSKGEQAELTRIYVERGVDPATAATVARQLMAKDALGAHARDELGISNATVARPVQAALASAASFTTGAALPLLVAAIAPGRWLAASIALSSLALLAFLGMTGARIGGADPWRAAARVTFWGALAMGVTAGIGRLVGAVV